MNFYGHEFFQNRFRQLLDDDGELFLWYGWPGKGSLFPAGTIVRYPHIANFRHAASMVWTYAEPEFRLSWIKLWISDNHYTTALHGFQLLSYLVMRIKNRMIIFLSYFPFLSSYFFDKLCGTAFLKVSENYNKETTWWGLYFVTPQVSGAKTFLRTLLRTF